MRYLTYHLGGEYRLGSLQSDYIVDVGMFTGFNDMLDLIEAGPKVWQEVAEQLNALDVQELAQQGGAVPFEAGLIAAPIRKPPKNVLCLGRNYYKHFLEGAVARGTDEKPPEAPIYFTKPHTSIIGAFDPIPADPEVSSKLDWEAELGLIIGVGGRKISKENAMQHVFGYTVINDISARDLQYKHQQWYKGKGLDYSCPMGPVIVTPDELPDPVHVPIKLLVNGEIKQDANTGQLMFDIPTIIADISMTMTLEAGDVISTGTPDGVGNYRTPPEYLTPGDIMETIIEGVGTMRNPITTPKQLELVTFYNHERDVVLNLVQRLQAEQHGLETECPGWSVKDLIAHLATSGEHWQVATQRMLDGLPNTGKAALDERNDKGVESRKDHAVADIMLKIIRYHHKNATFFLSLTAKQTELTGALASGEIITIAERFRRAGTHYREHGEMLSRATGLKLL